MKINKNPVILAILLVAVAAVLLIGTILFGKKGAGNEQEDTSGQASVSEPVGEAPPDSSVPMPGIPDVNAGQSSPEAPFDPVDWSGMSPTTLYESEILREVTGILDGLLKLDAKAIERVSERSTGGQYNPFRVMLDAVAADVDMKAAFLNMGRSSGYTVLGIEKSSANAYTVIIAATTPYVATLAAELSATDQIVQLQEVTQFKAGGAARAIAEMDMSAVPMNTDIVQLAIVVEDDVPILYHPNSFAYGNNSPQYAFLWGGIDFQGTQSGDLLLKNVYGASVELTNEEIRENRQAAQLVDYINTTLNTIRSANMNAISALELASDYLNTHWALKHTYPEYQGLFKKYEHLEAETASRLKSLEYTVTCYLNTERDTGAELYTITVTYSLTDSATGKRIYNTQYYALNKSSRKTLSKNDGNFVNDMMDVILEDALGGSRIMAIERLRLAGLWDE